MLRAAARCHIPCRSVTLHVAPMRLVVAPSPLILGSLALATRLNRGVVGGVVGGSPPRSPARAGSASSAGGKGRRSPSSPDNPVTSSVTGSKKGAPPDRLEAWTSPIKATLHADALALDSGRLDMLVSRNFAGGAGAAHLVMYGTVSMAARAAGEGRVRARRSSSSGLGSRRASGTGDAALPSPSSPPPPGDGLAMTLAVMSDSMGLPGDPETGDPVPALRIPVRGSADAPRVGWAAATADTLALMPEVVARAPGLGGLARWLSVRRAARDSRRPPLPPPAGVLPWAARLQRAGGSRRDEDAGAAKGPALVGKLVRAAGGKNSALSRRVSGGSLGKVFVRAPSK